MWAGLGRQEEKQQRPPGALVRCCGKAAWADTINMKTGASP